MAKGMTSKRFIIIFWALFLVPTLIVGIFAFKLLSHEQDRIQVAAQDALIERAKSISDTIHLTIEDVQQNLTLSLLAIDPNQVEKQLIGWEKSNPLVRNVFIYKRDYGLEYPLKGMESTKEERRFIARYNALFSGRTKFDFNRDDKAEELQKRSVSDENSRVTPYAVSKEKLKKSSRKALVALSRVRQETFIHDQSDVLAQEETSRFFQKSGWIPWFNENRLYILGWVQKQGNGPIYGVELELMTLLSRIVADFPKIDEKTAAMVMMDGRGNFMHQSGGLNVEQKQKFTASIPISDHLPHWRMALFVSQEGIASAKGFLYVSVLLLGVLICAMISGGILLTRMTLQNMKDALQKTSFVSSVSHELKTPLTSIRMYAELLQSRRIQDKEKTASYLSVIVDESHRLTRLINNVLDFGRLEQGKKTYHYTCFELDQFIEHIIDAHSIRIENQGIEVIRQITQGDFIVRADQDALEQVVLNLLDNALKYAKDGKFIKFILEKDGENIFMKICDDGPGISKQHRGKIFEKFYRADDSLSASQPGSGLGLSIARQILRDLGGDLFFEPMPQTGSCFTARIKKHGED